MLIHKGAIPKQDAHLGENTKPAQRAKPLVCRRRSGLFACSPHKESVGARSHGPEKGAPGLLVRWVTSPITLSLSGELEDERSSSR